MGLLLQGRPLHLRFLLLEDSYSMVGHNEGVPAPGSAIRRVLLQVRVAAPGSAIMRVCRLVGPWYVWDMRRSVAVRRTAVRRTCRMPYCRTPYVPYAVLPYAVLDMPDMLRSTSEVLPYAVRAVCRTGVCRTSVLRISLAGPWYHSS
eukprot:gene12197-biopygen5053